MDKTCSFLLPYAIILLNLQISCQAINPTSLVTDQSILLEFRSHITLDPYHVLARNWTNSSSICSWIGVTCSLHHQRVTALNISNMDLTGTISPQLGNLSFLVSLDLSYNFLSGDLPQQLSLLHRLKFISLKANNFGGEIPSWLGLLSELEYISLQNNSFIGFIPSSLSNLSNLQVLDFSFNSLQGNIPEELGKLHNLQTFRMQRNHLSGPIPSTIFKMSSLRIIDFPENELSGNLPSDMCSNLPLLERIYLFENKLSGKIPSSLSECSQLRIVSLSYNSFSGVILPEIDNLQKLTMFDIERNHITGTIPLSIFNVSSLQHLNLWDNELSGNLPSDIANLTQLKTLFLDGNNLTGALPPEIGKLYQLEKLGLSFNSFPGLIPPELFNMSTLRLLGLSDNGLLGELPINLDYGLPALEELYLGNNNLSGTIPESITNCSKLRLLSLASNKFTGFVPHSLGNLRLLERLYLFDNNLRAESSSSEFSFITSLTNCRSLNRLSIRDNPLDGIIPASVGNLSPSFHTFSASNCKIKGIIPEGIGNLRNLVRLFLQGNELTGKIPLTVKHLHKLQGLLLQNNNMRGSIPEGLCDLQSLVELELSRNEFSGRIPECLGNITSLRNLFLDSNMLNSSIPSSVWLLKDLLMLDLSSNSLSGFLSPEIGNLVRAITINLSMNDLSEFIPSTIGNLLSLTDLSLAHNGLEGSIPESMGRMISLVTVELSYNDLSGSIPKSLEALQYLDYFNVSFNALRGEIPTGGPFRNFTMESFKHNEALCGIPRFHVSLCRNASKDRSRMERTRFALFILSGVVAFIMLVSSAFIFMRYRRKDKTTSIFDGLVSIVPERISYYELLQAIGHFSETNLLGIGNFGSVYKGVLRDGKIFVVKVFKPSEAASKSFDVECEVLRNIRHRNLTKVISSCSNADIKALVLEYMPNGNLDRWLYSNNYFLDVMQRLNIMIDVAYALEYLHHGYSTPIVHCDLKPKNVLLDEEMVAHVSDFGIAKLLGVGESIVQTNTLATLGYIAPEYGLEGNVSTRCDVYSYGVMLMETFTRKRPSDDMFGGSLSLKSWVQSSLLQSSSEVIDANLLNPENEHFEKSLQCISSILELALQCSAESPGDRLNMKEALAEMQKIKGRFSRIMHPETEL